MSTKKLQILGSIGVGGTSEQVQADWDQTDSTAKDYIKNKPDEMDALLLVSEMGFVVPVVDADGNIYLDEEDNILTI